MNKLPIFTHNETKSFRFTNEQYYYLELEYNRYVIYKSLIKQIEKILNILDTTEYNNNNTNNNRKKYENKNILDRFVLECINHGITPQIEQTQEKKPEQNSEQNQEFNLEDSPEINDINENILLQYLFFNKNIENSTTLRNTSYYKKMIYEYNEKKNKNNPR